MNAGQMLNDVRLAVGPQAAVAFYGRTGGQVPMPEEILAQIGTLTPTPSTNGARAMALL